MLLKQNRNELSQEEQGGILCRDCKYHGSDNDVVHQVRFSINSDTGIQIIDCEEKLNHALGEGGEEGDGRPHAEVTQRQCNRLSHMEVQWPSSGREEWAKQWA